MANSFDMRSKKAKAAPVHKSKAYKRHQELVEHLLTGKGLKKLGLPDFVNSTKVNLQAAVSSALFKAEFGRLRKSRVKLRKAGEEALYTALVLPHFFSVPPLERAKEVNKPGSRSLMIGDTLIVKEFASLFPKNFGGILRALSFVANCEPIKVLPNVGIKWNYIQVPHDIIASRKVITPLHDIWGCRSLSTTLAAVLRGMGVKNVKVVFVPSAYLLQDLRGGLHSITTFEFDGKTHIADPMYRERRIIEDNTPFADFVEKAKKAGSWIPVTSAFDLVLNEAQRKALEKRFRANAKAHQK